MGQELLQHISYLEHLSYWGIFLAVMAAGHIVPVPESITLVLIGYVSVYTKLHLGLVIFSAFLGTIGIDILMYSISISGSKFALSLAKKVDERLLNRYLAAEEKHLFALVLGSHFIPGWRFANPIILGITKMPWKKFLGYSIVASIIHTPIYILLGFYLHTEIIPVVTTIESGGKLAFFLFAGLFLAYAAYFILNKKNTVYNRGTKDDAKE